MEDQNDYKNQSYNNPRPQWKCLMLEVIKNYILGHVQITRFAFSMRSSKRHGLWHFSSSRIHSKPRVHAMHHRYVPLGVVSSTHISFQPDFRAVWRNAISSPWKAKHHMMAHCMHPTLAGRGEGLTPGPKRRPVVELPRRYPPGGSVGPGPVLGWGPGPGGRKFRRGRIWYRFGA